MVLIIRNLLNDINSGLNFMKIHPNNDMIKKTILDVPDYPKLGIVFKDITPLLENPQVFKAAILGLEEQIKSQAKQSGRKIDKILAIESRGFIFGAPLAIQMGLGLVIARKPKKLPRRSISVTIDLEYGSDALAIHQDSLKKNENVLVIDDVLATGGTAAGACQLIQESGANPVQAAFLIELSFLHGRQRLTTQKELFVHSLIRY
jgi:adenine phosphoribosyltransferase